jgi:hypothetical protein
MTKADSLGWRTAAHRRSTRPGSQPVNLKGLNQLRQCLVFLNVR